MSVIGGWQNPDADPIADLYWTAAGMRQFGHEPTILKLPAEAEQMLADHPSSKRRAVHVFAGRDPDAPLSRAEIAGPLSMWRVDFDDQDGPGHVVRFLCRDEAEEPIVAGD
jgi:hypothetical protein